MVKSNGSKVVEHGDFGTTLEQAKLMDFYHRAMIVHNADLRPLRGAETPRGKIESSPMALKAVLMVLNSYAGANLNTHPKVASIAQRACMQERATSRAIRDLVRLGLLAWRGVPGSKHRDFVINYEALGDMEAPPAEVMQAAEEAPPETRSETAKKPPENGSEAGLSTVNDSQRNGRTTCAGGPNSRARRAREPERPAHEVRGSRARGARVQRTRCARNYTHKGTRNNSSHGREQPPRARSAAETEQLLRDSEWRGAAAAFLRRIGVRVSQINRRLDQIASQERFQQILACFEEEQRDGQIDDPPAFACWLAENPDVKPRARGNTR